MKLVELIEFLQSLPEEFNKYDCVNGEYSVLGGELYHRVDKPILSITVNEETKEVLFLHQTQEKIIQIQK